MKTSIHFLLTFLLSWVSGPSMSLDTLQVNSPSGNIRVKIWLKDQLYYSIALNDSYLLAPSAADLLLIGKKSFSSSNRIRSYHLSEENNIIISPVPEKRNEIIDHYNIMTIKFKQPFTVQFRVYNDGVAYRFATSFKDSIFVGNEIAEFNFASKTSAYFPGIQKRGDADIFHTSFEEIYRLRDTDSIQSNELAYNPVLVVPAASNHKIAICESDLFDYPGMFLAGTAKSSFKAKFAGYPLQESLTKNNFPQLNVTKRANYIAKTIGTRTFPWRVFLISEEDKSLPSNDLVYRLASPSVIPDASWIKPGKGTDEWIVNVNLFNVPFRSGINTASYKYYIDFAKHFGFDRIMMDAGWSELTDLFKINPALNMDTILSYAREKNIKVSMWTLAHTLDKQLDSALEQFNKWGVDYIMTDFIDRDDQLAINFYHRIAKACAEHRIMIMFHGASPQRGFNRSYPNNVTREGVLGSEYNIWSDNVTPAHDVTLPFTRMLAGSFDYEPGILNNATQKGFRQIGDMVQSQGTRSHQLAMFIVYDCPMPLFAGNPSQGWTEPAFMKLLGSLPSTWDETIILDGKVGQYIVSAREKNQNWFVAGMTDWSPREINIHFDFLNKNEKYQATICRDGINADRYAADYHIYDTIISRGDFLTMQMAPGGGFLIKLEKIQK